MNTRTTNSVISAALAFLVSVVGLVVGVTPASARTLDRAIAQSELAPEQQPAQSQLVSDDPAAFTPNVLDGQVNAIAVLGNRVVLAGDFTRAQNASGGPILTRNYILAFDRATGAIDTAFVPVLDGVVRTLAPSADGLSVYVGGSFNKLNGATAYKVTKITLSTGLKAGSFNAGLVNALVYDVKLVNNRLFIAGQFTQVAKKDRSLVAELDPTTGALRGAPGPVFAGTHHGGPTFIYKFDVNPDGQTLAAIGNFATVDGLPRMQAAMLSIGAATPTLTDWQTARYEPMCYDSFQYYVRDVDYAPDGGYFVITTTGGYGSGPPSLCDGMTRWDADARGQALNPKWAVYTGGDSSYAVAVTGAAIYVGGHQRWWNNPFASDAQGPGAVSREGIAALDPVNGVPLSWNPTRDRGRGVFDLVATTEGLWVGSDTDRIGDYEYHARIAFFPLAGGHVVPQPDPAALPVDAYVVGSATTSRYLDRINAAGSALLSGDSGPDWAVDTAEQPSNLHNAGSNTAGYPAVPTVDATVPATTPRAVFDTERWDPGGGDELEFTIPAQAGEHLEVRLYFANRCSCTSTVGSRVFDVSIDGTVVLDDYDIVADVGTDVGTMKSFPVTSDGAVDIDFGHVVENPLVNAIEIVNLDAPASDETTVARWTFDGDSSGPVGTLPANGVDWGTVRGGFWLEGKLYLALSDGTLTVRSFDGTTAGPATTLNLYGLTGFASELSQLSGLYYSEGSIFFTLFNDPNLYQRAFSVESGIVGATRTTVAAAGVDWRQARGMFLSDSGLFWSDAATGDLHRIGFVDATLQAGSDTVVSGPANDGRDWRGKAMFALPGTPPNQAPTASFTSGCVGMTCSFDASASRDMDGTVVSYSWAFGDGTFGTGVQAQHAYAGPGTYAVTLTVTDDDGATGTATGQATVVVSAIAFVGSAQQANSGSVQTQTVTLPPGIAAGDQLVLTMAFNSAAATVANPVGWTRSGENKSAAITMVVWTRIATSGSAGSVVSVRASEVVRSSLIAAAYRGAVLAPSGVSVARETVNRSAHTTPIVTAPTGSWVVSNWADKTAATTKWTPPAGQAVRQTGAGTGAGHIAWLTSDTGAAVSAGPVGGLVATADSATANAVMSTVVLAPKA